MASLVKANEKLSHQLGIRRNNLSCKDSPAPRPKNLFPHCKIEVMNAPNSSFGLNKSVTRCRLVWKGCFWWWGTSKIVDNKVNGLSHSPSSDLILSHRCSTPPFYPIPYHIKIQKTQSSIVDSGASGYLFTKDVPKKNVDTKAPHIRVGTASGQLMISVSTCDLLIP